MYSVYFYRDRNGREPASDYIATVSSGKGLINRLRRLQILDAMNLLRRQGTVSRMPFVRHVFDNLWELRLLCDRILFLEWLPGTYVILHGYNWRTCENSRREYIRTRTALSEVMCQGDTAI